jgi:hypothetical protein
MLSKGEHDAHALAGDGASLDDVRRRLHAA